MSQPPVRIGFDTAAPRFSAAAAEAIVREKWAVDGTATALPSERDQNFRIRSEHGLHVLKIANASEDESLLGAQNRAMQRVGAVLGSLVQVPVAVAGAETLVTVESGGERFLVRLLTYLPGKPLGLLAHQPPVLIERTGAALARVDAALEGYDDPAFHRVFYWDLEHALDVIEDTLPAVTQRDTHAMVTQFVARFRGGPHERIHDLREAVIHNDPNDFNVLIDAAGQVSGLLDFGDVVWSRTVYDPAILMAYAITAADSPLIAAAYIARGYHAVYPLTPAELAVIYPLACLRLCQSACIGAVQAEREPGNAYLSVSQRRIGAVLPEALSISFEAAEAVVRANCGLPPVSGGDQTAAWFLRRSRVMVDAPHGWRIRDGSPGALDPAGSTQWSAGRHLEPRHTELPALGDPTVHRQVLHLGSDLRMPAGTPVRAPLEGVVESAGDEQLVLRHASADGQVWTLVDGVTVAVVAGDRVEAGSVLGRSLGEVNVRLALTPGVPRFADAELAAVWAELSPDPGPLIGVSAGVRREDEPALDETLRRRGQVISPSLSVSYTNPLKIVRGEGAYLIDQSGRRYLDCVNNVAHVGHANPRVVAALAAQSRVLNTNMRYLHDRVVEYAEALVARLPEPLSVCFFVNSGSEANDLALRIARTVTGRRTVLTLGGAYHGNSQSDIEVSPYKYGGPGGGGRASWVRELSMPDPYRGRYRGMTEQAGRLYAHEIETVLTEAGARAPAASICEPILSCGGQIEPPPRYLEHAFAAVRRAGGICIADEVQIGFGRVGDSFWGFELQQVVPDIVTMGKPIGNGHPLAAVVTTAEIATAFDNGMEYFNTFGGNPVSAAVGLAVLEEIDAGRLQESARVVGGRVLDGLRGLAESYEVVGDCRGRGMFLGIEFVADRNRRTPNAAAASDVTERMREQGVLLSTDGPDHNVIKIKPPLVFGDREAQILIEKLDGTLRAIA